MFVIDYLRSVFQGQEDAVLPTSHSEISLEFTSTNTCCTTCSAINIKKLLRHGLDYDDALPLGFLLDIIKKSDDCALCYLISTLIRRRWRLDENPDVDLNGIECSIFASSFGDLIPQLKDKELCHRLHIRWSYRPLKISDFMETAHIELTLAIQLLEEDAQKLSRREDFHGRRMKDVVDVGLIRTWLNLCESDHGAKCSSMEWQLEGESLPNCVRMVDMEQMSVVQVPPNCRYVALSYVWGGPGDHYWTTLANTSSRSHPCGLDESVLPATILDAIHLGRQLGERYLWIDALCIIQDSDSDKADQVHTMHLIYARATLTLFAAGGENVRSGLSGLFAGTRVCKQDIRIIQGLHLALPLPTPREAIGQSLWNTRGWTLQEVELSRRRIFFTKEQVYFECRGDIWCEDIVESKTPGRIRGSGRYNGVAQVLSISDSLFWQLNSYASAVTLYSRRNLSDESDIAIAISALTNIMANGDESPSREPKVAFRFGMWMTNLDLSLLWQPTLGTVHLGRRTAVDREHSRWPTWAWAGWRGQVNYMLEGQFDGSLAGVTHTAPDESLVTAWYMVNEDTRITQVHPRRFPVLALVDLKAEKSRPPKYLPPACHPDDSDVGFLPPAGSLIFRSRCAHLQVRALNNTTVQKGEASVHAIFCILLPGLESMGHIGKIILPTSIPSYTLLRFVVISRCGGRPGVWDESSWGRMYTGCSLHVIAVQPAYNDSRVVERIGIGTTIEGAWLRPELRVEDCVIVLA